MLERGAVEVLPDEPPSQDAVEPYEMRDRNGEPSLFGVARNPDYTIAGLSPPQKLREMMHSDCPLCGCEDFAGQELFPVAPTVRPRRLDRAAAQRLFPLGRVAAIDHGARSITVSSDSTETFGVVDGTRALVYQRVRLTQEQIEASQAAGGGAVLTLGGGAQYQVVEERPVPTPAPVPRSRVPPHVARHRPRLDGRRRT